MNYQFSPFLGPLYTDHGVYVPVTLYASHAPDANQPPFMLNHPQSGLATYNDVAPHSSPTYSSSTFTSSYVKTPCYSLRCLSSSLYTSSREAPDLQVPDNVIHDVREVMNWVSRIQADLFDDLNHPRELVDAAHKRIVRDAQMERDYPEGGVILNPNGIGEPATAWRSGALLPREHPWNLFTLHCAAYDACMLRGDLETDLIGASGKYASCWGFDLPRTSLPSIIPHPNPPPRPQDPTAAKRQAREMTAFKWLYPRPDYGYGHLHALSLHDAATYGVVQEFAKAVSLQHSLMAMTQCSTLHEALRAVEREKWRRRRVRPAYVMMEASVRCQAYVRWWRRVGRLEQLRL